MSQLAATYTPPTIDRTTSLSDGKVSPSWSAWDRHGLPMGIDFDIAALCPELPAAQADGVRLQRHLEVAINAHGADRGVGSFLGNASDHDDLLDRRALVVLLAHLSNLEVLPQLPLPEDLHGRGPGLRRLLRPLEFVMLRAAARDARRATLLRLIAAGATETECARLCTDQVSFRDDGQIGVRVGGGRGRAVRIVVLSPGSDDAIRHLLDISDDGYLIPLDAIGTGTERVETINKTLRRLLASTGLGADPSATVASIRNTGLRAVHDTFGLETAAAVAGTDNLQVLRQELGLTKRKPSRRQTR